MFDLPITLSVQNYAVAVDSSMNVNSLPATSGAVVSLICDFQLRTPGAILQEFGIEVTSGGFVYSTLSDSSKMAIGSTFTYQGRTFVFKTHEITRADGFSLDYAKALAVELNG
jgi:hypothetical protein